MTLAVNANFIDEDGTGPELRSSESEWPNYLRLTRQHAAQLSASRASVTDQFVREAQRTFDNQDPQGAERLATVGLILAKMVGVPFLTVAQCLGLSETALIRIIHGETPISEGRHREWSMLLESLANLHRILEPEATFQWLEAAIPSLSGKTALELLRRRKYDLVVNLTRAYLDPSFA